MSIKNYIDKNYDSLIDTWKSLCVIPSPSLHEEKRAEFCKAWLEGIGAEGVYIDEANNCIYPISCDGSNDITVFVAHIDVVFADTTPLPLVDDGEKVHCPGCGDDTASVAMLLYATKYLIENNIKPQRGILIAFVGGEEGLGNLAGTKCLMKKYAGRVKRFVSFDGNIWDIYDSCVGSYRYKVTARTAGGHSFADFGKKNAIAVLSEIISKIYEIKVPTDGDSHTTYNVGTIIGGTSVNSIAQKSEMLCEYRSDNVELLAVMDKRFNETFESAKSEETNIEVECVGSRPCAKGVDQNRLEALCTSALDVIESVSGTRPIPTSASTDCNIPLSMGIPSICVGTYAGVGEHTRDEWIEKASLRNGLEVVIRTILELGL